MAIRVDCASAIANFTGMTSSDRHTAKNSTPESRQVDFITSPQWLRLGGVLNQPQAGADQAINR